MGCTPRYVASTPEVLQLVYPVGTIEFGGRHCKCNESAVSRKNDSLCRENLLIGIVITVDMDGIYRELAAEIGRAIHGEELARSTACDICAQSLNIETPVQYDVLRIASQPAQEMFPFLPDFWVADAARCEDCSIQALGPTTEGLEEALVKVSVTEFRGMPRIDCTDIELIDYSSIFDGHRAPTVDVRLVYLRRDFGLFRWMRIRECLRHNPKSSPVRQIIQDRAKESDDIPPSVARLTS